MCGEYYIIYFGDIRSIGDITSMVENIKLGIIESHEEILGLIDRNIGTLVNFDYHADYPFHTKKIFDVDQYADVILEHYPGWMDCNWVTILVSKGCVSQYIWFYPNACVKDDIKILNSKNGNCLVYNIKFNRNIKIEYKFVTIDACFFGCKLPVHWKLNDDDRKGLFIDILQCINARNITLIICKSKRHVNYDVDKFLDNITKDISKTLNIEKI